MHRNVRDIANWSGYREEKEEAVSEAILFLVGFLWP
mgnify:CR=1 FL=1